MVFRVPARPGTRPDAAWRIVPWIFLALALATSLFVAFRTPPAMGPDEAAHMFRADMLTLGELAPHRFVDQGHPASGAPVDEGLAQLFVIFSRLPFHPEARTRRADFSQAGAVRWSGRLIPVNFFNTAIYAPVLYLPATAGLEAGKVVGAPVVASAALARVLGALCCVLVGFLALRLAGEARALMAILMLTPMSTFLFGVINQDGPTIALTALGAVLMTQGARAARPLTGGELWGAAAAFALVGLAKAPYALFGLALLWTQVRSRRQRWAAALAPLLIGLAWAAWMQATVAAPPPGAGDIEPARQLQHLLRHPGALPALATGALRMHGGDYARQFVGQLGWLDALLPRLYYRLASIVLILAAVAAAAGARLSGPGRLAWAVIGLSLTVSVGVFLALYLDWTPVGGTVVEGVQGRYFLPVALFLCAAFDSGRSPSAAPTRLHAFGAGLTVLIGVAGLAATAFALSVRYYV